ncbi:histidine kinase [Mycobacterium stomatepiae]|uniref:histidine kinase n=2 Tax=Mycobacterium stomatepiae TaxID=470076 RepID=A0A7I7Q7S4_9MYCO|nr:histidine kinase [Mycobacterium stomatepiae]
MIADAHPRAQLTVRGWLFLVLFSMGVLVLAGAAAGTVLLNRTDEVTRSLSQEIQPARRAAIQLQAAVRDQETGVRGYAIAADRQFLTPYYDGQHAEHAAAEEIRQLVGQRVDLLNDLDAIERATANWRASFAEPLIASVTPHYPDVVNSRVVDRGKAEFDHLRELFDNQNADFVAASTHATDELKDIRAWRDRVLGAVVLVFFGLAITLGLLTRGAITLPLASLAAACRRITEGNFTESITPPRRPKDIHDMAIDVENMRQRIVSALEISRASGARLDEQAIELKRSNAELEQFAYVPSHDLQEPLRKVASFCQLLEKRYGDQLDERGIEYIGYAVDGAKRMQVLINDLLTFSRVGRMGGKQTKVELDTTLDAALANLAIAIEESNTEIVRPARPLPQVVGDPTLLTMLWQNLIGNAIKFRHVDRSPRIVIDCESSPDAREWLLTVSDNGIGIAPEFTEKVFVIFQRLHGRGVYAGTGVGLALVKKIVEYHDGAVRIDTTYTDGTRFEFTLPVAVDIPHQSALEGAHQ